MGCTTSAVFLTGIGEPAPRSVGETHLARLWSKTTSARSVANLPPRRSCCCVPKLSVHPMLVQSLQHPFSVPLGESQRKICNLIPSPTALTKIFGKI